MERIVVNSFPRSASHFSVQCMLEAFPSLTIVPKPHVLSELSKNPCTFTVIREPSKAIASWMNFERCDYPDNYEGNLEWYIRFSKELLSNIDKVYFAEFNSFVKDPTKDLLSFAIKFGLPNPEPIDVTKVFEYVKLMFPKNVPIASRDYEQDRQRLLTCKNYPLAQEVYESLLVATL
jgi:hypothetical protein